MLPKNHMHNISNSKELHTMEFSVHLHNCTELLELLYIYWSRSMILFEYLYHLQLWSGLSARVCTLAVAYIREACDWSEMSSFVYKYKHLNKKVLWSSRQGKKKSNLLHIKQKLPVNSVKDNSLKVGDMLLTIITPAVKNIRNFVL